MLQKSTIFVTTTTWKYVQLTSSYVMWNLFPSRMASNEQGQVLLSCLLERPCFHHKILGKILGLASTHINRRACELAGGNHAVPQNAVARASETCWAHLAALSCDRPAGQTNYQVDNANPCVMPRTTIAMVAQH